MEPIKITENKTIPKNELSTLRVLSRGPGGQNVNKSCTQVVLIWDMSLSQALTIEEKAKFCMGYSRFVNSRGEVKVACDQFRTQNSNLECAIEKLREMLILALKTTKPRKSTKPPRWVKERRLNDKKMQSNKKQLRKTIA